MQRLQTHTEAKKSMGAYGGHVHPWGHTNVQGGVQTYGGVQILGCADTP